MVALRFTEADLNMVLSNEGRTYNQHFQTYKFYFSMRMRFSQHGDSVVYVGDLINFHGEVLDHIFEQIFRLCATSVNLQHFNRNSIIQDDFVQFTLEHTDFVDYVYSSRNIKFSELHYEMLVGGVINWLNNLAQSNRQMNIDNDWAITLQVLQTTGILRGFGTDQDDDDVMQPVVKTVNSTSPVFDPEVIIGVNVPRPSYDGEIERGIRDEENEEE